MSRAGTCETGCGEHKLLLVRAATIDALTRAEGEILASIAALRPPVEDLAHTPTPPEPSEGVYDVLRARARTALSHPLRASTTAYVLDDEPASPAATWFCDRCGGVDAPQPCLGICVWRPLEWTHYDIYVELRGQVLSSYADEEELRTLLRRIANTDPRPGQHTRTWEAYAKAAANLLAGQTTQPAR